MKGFITVSRLIVGILFVFSGLVKANDPLGLAYKMQEFFDVWAQSGITPGFMHAISDYALSFSILMIAFEIVSGVAVLIGWEIRIFSWLLLLLIIFFSFLTGYAYLSGKFRTCGCFGDCIPISPFISFLKDLVLLILILFLVGFRNLIQPAFPKMAGAFTMMLSVLFSFGLQWYVLMDLPIADCLPFKVGNNIPQNMKIPAGAIPDSTVISFVYLKEGKEIEFTSDHFPDDFDDSTYHFVKRYDKLVRKGNAEAPIKDFNLKTLSGLDTTSAVLQDSGYKLILFMKDIDEAGTGWMPDYKKILELNNQKGFSSYIVTASTADRIAAFESNWPLDNTTILSCDPVPIKTAARANPTLYLLKGGDILGKWSQPGFTKAIDLIHDLPPYSRQPRFGSRQRIIGSSLESHSG